MEQAVKKIAAAVIFHEKRNKTIRYVLKTVKTTFKKYGKDARDYINNGISICCIRI